MTTRRDVLRHLTGIAVLGALPLSACSDGGDDGGGSDAGSDATTRDASSDATADAASDDGGGSACDSVSHQTDLHPHTLTISASDVAAGVEKTYTLGGAHTHSLTITAAMFAMLQSSETVMLSSTGGAHTHQVTLTCG